MWYKQYFRHYKNRDEGSTALALNVPYILAEEQK